MNGPVSKLEPTTRDWLEHHGFSIRDEALWVEALTHGSTGDDRDYQRLEFLGDRVLGLTIAGWLYERNKGAEGKLAQRLNALVSKDACARVSHEIGASDHVRLGKQARDDGAAESDNVLGDIMESLLGANHIEAGYDATRDIIRTLWADQFDGGVGRAKHPKSALQEWAAAGQHRPPHYELTNRSGPDHKSNFTVRVGIKNVGDAEASASSKQEAEKLAAENFMKEFG